MRNMLSRAFAGFAVVLMHLLVVSPASAQSLMDTLAPPVAEEQTYDEEGRPETRVVVALPDASGSDFYSSLGFEQVFPGFWLTPTQIDELRAGQSTGGPDGLFVELREEMSEKPKERLWGSPWANRRLDDYIKSGAQAWLLTAMPTSMRFTIYDKAVNRDQNVKCWTDIPPGRVTQLAFTCVDTKNGAQVVGDTVAGVFQTFIPLAGATVLGNVTAPRAGDVNYDIGANAGNQNAVTAGASANARSEGSPVTVNNTANSNSGVTSVNQLLNNNQSGYVPCSLVDTSCPH